MNRYLIQGIVRDAEDGKKVAVLIDVRYTTVTNIRYLLREQAGDSLLTETNVDILTDKDQLSHGEYEVIVFAQSYPHHTVLESTAEVIVY